MEAQEDRYAMIDLETLDTEPSAVIISAGLIIFTKDKIVAEKYMEFDVVEQIITGRTVSRDTVLWHKRQHTDYKQIIKGGTESLSVLHQALMETKLLNEETLKGVWTRGHFDVALLEDAEIYPFPYWMQRDVRTLDTFLKMEAKNTHNALDDARNQVAHVQEVIRRFDAVS